MYNRYTDYQDPYIKRLNALEGLSVGFYDRELLYSHTSTGIECHQQLFRDLGISC